MKAYLEIEMPKSCYYCPMTNDGYYLCKVTSPFKELEDDCEERRPDWCPLIPTADVRPVVRGKWVGYPECLKYANAYSDDHIVCSACEECFSILDNDCGRFNFCPNCGAEMREER